MGIWQCHHQFRKNWTFSVFSWSVPNESTATYKLCCYKAFSDPLTGCSVAAQSSRQPHLGCAALIYETRSILQWLSPTPKPASIKHTQNPKWSEWKQTKQTKPALSFPVFCSLQSVCSAHFSICCPSTFFFLPGAIFILSNICITKGGLGL